MNVIVDWIMVAFLITALGVLWACVGFAAYMFWHLWKGK